MQRTSRPVRHLLTRSFYRTTPRFQNKIQPVKDDKYVVDNKGYKHFKSGASSNNYLYYVYAIAGVTTLYILSRVDKEPVFNRRRVIFGSKQAEIKEGERAFAHMRAQYHELPPNHPYSIQLRRIGARLVKVVPGSDFNWEFIVVDNPMINAACLPGGKVIFFKGIMDLLGSDDAQIAAVMGHEISHALMRHHMEARGFNSIIAGFAFIIRSVFGIRFGGDALLLNLGVLLPFSRKHETEADLVGLMIMARANYNPERAIVAFQKMSQKKGSINSYFSTHPSDTDRIALLRKNIPTAKEEKSMYGTSGYIDVWHQGLHGKFKF